MEGTSGMKPKNLAHLRITAPKMAGPRGRYESYAARLKPGIHRISRRHADVGPRAPLDGGAGLPTLTAEGPDRVERVIGGRVVGLATAANHSSERRKQDAGVKRRGGARLLQREGTKSLGRIHMLNRHVGLAAQQAVGEDAGRMPHAEKATTALAKDATNHTAHLDELGTVAAGDAHIAVRTTEVAPRSASHLALRRPRPPVPPEIRCAPVARGSEVSGTRTTTLPVFSPFCNVRKAAMRPDSISKVWSGRPCSTPAAARPERMRRVPGDGDVFGGGCRLQALVAPHGALADLAEAAVLTEQREGTGDEVEREAVQREADALDAQ
eukprot:scaffold36275_cov154-Isochrysis_galbana.AAC.8